MGELLILSRDSVPFRNRMEAGFILAQELKRFVHDRPVVVGIPRGGVVVAAQVAMELDCELDIILSRKLGAPGNPEFAMGAVTEDGTVFINERAFPEIDEQDPYVQQEREQQMSEIERRRSMFRVIRPKVSFTGRTVILVDDGIATGSTMEAALWSARNERPKLLIAALPVSPAESLDKLTADADFVLCVRVSEQFSAVGQFYEEFPQIPDTFVVALLKESLDNVSVPHEQKVG
jgi:putative phosphoribosyl transferase